jgi:dephospho-CoA kinase
MTKESRPYVVGLTGGIGSGKSTACLHFANLGATIIDADEIARTLTAPGNAVLASISSHFGPEILKPDGSLDRPALRQLVFTNPAGKHWLEQLLHPLIRQQINAQIQHSKAEYVILAVPLLLESGQYDFVDRVLVMDLPEPLQLQRATARDGDDAASVSRIMAAQISRQARLAAADDVLDNSGTPEQLATEIKRLHDYYRAQARRHQTS